jgi:hypothetical protein
MNYIDRLKDAVADHATVLVLGTGVSKALSGNAATADWFGLVENGIAYAQTLGASERWGETQKSTLAYALEEGDDSALITVASQVQTKLRSFGPQAYFDWLRDTVGSLPLEDASLARALHSLNCPILTTNYDLLLEQALKLPHVVWSEQEKMRGVLKSGGAVGHLHGVWEQTTSVVLSETDYHRILSSDPAQHLQQSHYSMKSFVFIGYGAGLSDPNFGNMLEIHRRLFPESNHDHFRLCREDDLAQLQVQHASDSIRPVAYGQHYEDLAPFLRSLVPQGKKNHGRGDTVAFATEAILDQLRAETVIADELSTTDDRELHEITVPPLFLPLPHEQFASYQGRADEDERPEKRDAVELYSSEKLVVLVGEEGAGVSTALRWLVTHAATTHHRAAPLYIDSRSCRSQTAALRREVTQEAIARRLIDKKSEELPSHVLAVDNVKPASTRAYESLVEDLRASKAKVIFVGVRPGDEASLVDALTGGSKPVEVVYLGKPGRDEVKTLVRMIAPAMNESLADQVIQVVRRERLQRNPFNIALLIVLLARGAGTNLNSSDTAVLDKYVQLLLGRSGNFLDPRWTLDPQNREAALAHLAKHMVQQNAGGLLRSEAIAQLENYFASVDWQEDPDATLETFRSMRLLRIQDGVVQFQQTAYLHLFAAKAAIDDEAFLSELLTKQLYYGPIIRHYAALVRQSDRVVRELLHSLQESWPITPPQSKIYEETEALPAPATTRVLPEEDTPAKDAPGQDVDPDEDDVEDWGEDGDRVPFPLDDPSTWSLTQQLIAVLDLSSRVVRDSDQVDDLALKDELFAAVLERWGYLTDVMAGDNFFREVVESVVLGVPAETDEEQEQQRRFIHDLQLTMPMFVALTGINATLASRKLLRTYERSLSNDAGTKGIFTDIAALLFAFLVAEPGWASSMPEIAAQHSRLWVVPNFVYGLAGVTYQYQHLTDKDQASIEAFFEKFLNEFHVFKDNRHRRTWVGEEMERIRKERKMTRGRLAEGERAIDVIVDDLHNE